MPKTRKPDIYDQQTQATSDDGYARLCMAVIAQAAKDRAEWFFKSNDIKIYLTARIDPIALWEQIKTNFKKNGSWKASKDDDYDI